MSPHAPETCVDHYVFWRVHPVQVDETVKLQDQFREKPFEATLRTVEYLGNPARKLRRGREEEDIHHRKVHLLSYELANPQPGPPNPPIVRNQFTTEEGQKWQLGRTRFLLIPARKARAGEEIPDTPPPPRVDHFLCYDVLEAPGVEETMDLEDQFGTTNSVFLKPVLFGVPVDKNGEGLIHPDVHLAIYEVHPRLRPPASPAVRTVDQLQRHELNAIESIWLAVPSLKEWKRG